MPPFPSRAVRTSLATPLALLVMAWPMSLGAMAESIDAAALTELTPEAAGRLVAEFPGVLVDLKGWGADLPGDALPLTGLKSLSSEAANALATA
jgi:hypothetical protein